MTSWLHYNMPNDIRLGEEIVTRATQLGFAKVGIIPAAPAQTFSAYADWLEQGMHGDMAWMKREDHMQKRKDVREILPTAKSIVTLLTVYRTEDLPFTVLNDPSRGIFARYAWGKDYHKVIKRRLITLIKEIEMLVGHPTLARAYVDTGPVLERELAQRAGLGFIGNNSMLINSSIGSYVFLSEIILDEECEPLQHRARGGCRTCTNCSKACPTSAIIAPGKIDARKCISYLTIECKGSIPIELRPLMKNRIYGCDICQEVCPWNATAGAKAQGSDWLEAELFRQAPPLLDLASLTETTFLERFQGTPIMRAKRSGLLRNVAIALGNWGSAEAMTVLQKLAQDSDPIIREHAEWGLQQ